MSEMEGQVSIFDQDIWCGKTCVAASQVPEKVEQEKTSELSWKSWQGLSKKESQFLDLRRVSGVPQESSSAMGIQLHGLSKMPNIGAFLNVEEGLHSLLTSTDTMHLALYLENTNPTEAPCEEIPSHLSGILEENPDPKYRLSSKACLGILNRASRRGKKLPPMLEEALIYTVVEDTEYGQKGIADTIEILREMRCEIGEEALKEWVQRVFVLVQSEEVLLGDVCEPCEDSEDSNECIVVEDIGEQDNREEGMCDLWSNGEVGDTPQGREPNEQLQGELDLLMQKLSHENAQKAVILYCLRIACEGEEAVSEALSAISERENFGADDSIGVDIYNTALTGDKVCPLTSGGITSTVTCPKVMTPVTFEPGIASREGGHIYEGVSGTLRANAGDNQMALAYTLQDREGKAGGGKGALIAKELSATLRAGFAQTLFQPVLALDRASFNQGKNAQYDFEVSDKGVNSPIVAKGPGAVCYSVDQGGGKSSVDIREDKSPTLTTTHHGAPAVAYCIGNGQAHDAQRPDKELYKTLNCMDDPMKICIAVDCRNGTEDVVNGALQSNSAHSLNRNNVVRTRYIVRRLTPLECERLQGYPDGWTDIGEWTDSNGKKRQTSDAARYKALGNSIALPPWKWVLKRICACYERDATMASLFDGIGGFPYLWEQLNGKGTCLWASEIEEFPIAVTKVRIGE